MKAKGKPAGLDVKSMKSHELREKIRKTQKLICTDTELSSHLLDLAIREIEACREELCLRNIESKSRELKK